MLSHLPIDSSINGLSPSADILIIDDTPANLRLLMSVLTEQGYRVRPVTNGQLAIDAAQLDPPDLILLDIKMPDLDGYEVCDRLKSDERTRDIPVIFLTVLDDVVDIVKGFELGGVDYITKPVRTGELIARIENQVQLQSLQRQISAQEDFLRSIYNGVEASISVLDVSEDGQFRIVEVNDTALRMSGLSRTQMIGTDLRQLLPPEIIRRNHQACLETGSSVMTEEPVELHGKTTWWLSTHTPLRDNKGDITRIIGTGINITDRREAELQLAERTAELSQTLETLKNTQSDLIRSAKMAALGNLVAGVAHEINTPVGTAIMTASTLENASQEISQNLTAGNIKRSSFESYLSVATECSQLILNNLQRAGELVQSFKQIAVDQSSLHKRTFVLKPYLQEVITNLTPKLKLTPHQITIVGDEDITLSSYPGAIAQVITNLVINSLTHAYPDGQAGHLNLTLSSESPNSETSSQTSLSQTDIESYTQITYSDNGCGIPPENQNRIFEPFFTTARAQGGSGLGLHLVYNLVTQTLEGTISVTHQPQPHQPQQGTTFTITLPNRVSRPQPDV
ncbi:MAG: response regulator [Phormidesmis sp.]